MSSVQTFAARAVAAITGAVVVSIWPAAAVAVALIFTVSVLIPFRSHAES